MRVCCLGSGSSGNAVLVEADDGERRTRVLVDAGFSARDLEARLDLAGVGPTQVDAILITHDHGDHTRGMGVFARRHGTPVHLTERTFAACRGQFRGSERTQTYTAARPFQVGSLRAEPFMTAHDAADPVAVALVDVGTGARVGIATDLGRPTAGVRHALTGCDFLVLEANHDEVMLRVGPYPRSVQARIASSHGHLSNQAAARFAIELAHPRLAGVLLAHVSAQCNDPELAKGVVGSALERAGWRGWIDVARQEAPGPWLDVELLRTRCGPEQLTLL